MKVQLILIFIGIGQCIGHGIAFDQSLESQDDQVSEVKQVASHL